MPAPHDRADGRSYKRRPRGISFTTARADQPQRRLPPPLDASFQPLPIAQPPPGGNDPVADTAGRQGSTAVISPGGHAMGTPSDR
jgi:hypothetical protein